MSDRRTLLLTRRAVRVKGRRVIARFLLQPGRAAVITLPTHNDARRAAQRLIVQLRLTKTDEEWDADLGGGHGSSGNAKALRPWHRALVPRDRGGHPRRHCVALSRFAGSVRWLTMRAARFDFVAMAALVLLALGLTGKGWLDAHPEHTPWAPLDWRDPAGGATARKLATSSIAASSTHRSP